MFEIGLQPESAKVSPGDFSSPFSWYIPNNTAHVHKHTHQKNKNKPNKTLKQKTKPKIQTKAATTKKTTNQATPPCIFCHHSI